MFEEVLVAQYEALLPYLPGRNSGNYKTCVTIDEGPTPVTHGKRKEILEFQTFFSVRAEIFLIQMNCTLCWFTCTLLLSIVFRLRIIAILKENVESKEHSNDKYTYIFVNSMR